MFERPHGGERAVLVFVDFGCPDHSEQKAEFLELAISAGVVPTGFIEGSRAAPDPKLFVGAGKAEEIRSLLLQSEAELALFNHDLSPAQERNLERLFQRRVLDRTGLILDIFAQRAGSFEGKLQVELAQLRHLSTRLVRGWTHLERQKGGIGLRGPGETQLESDRRLIRARIVQTHKKLERVRRHRQMSQKTRRKANVPVVALIGYTNAGKSTLFNRLTDSSTYVADRLFATLDPTYRKCSLPDGLQVIASDTVGFIRRLPHDLVAAFRATLEQVAGADLLLHVIDATPTQRQMRIDAVEQVLDEIGARRVPCLRVFNKIDLLPPTDKRRVHVATDNRNEQVWISATSGSGVELLKRKIADMIKPNVRSAWVRLPPNAGRLRARLYGEGAVVDETYADDGSSMLNIEMSTARLRGLYHSEGFEFYPVAGMGMHPYDPPHTQKKLGATADGLE